MKKKSPATSHSAFRLPNSELSLQPATTADPQDLQNPYKFIGDQCRLSERTIRTAFSKKPITWTTARIIEKHTGIPTYCFRIKPDNRGTKKARS